MWGLDLLSHFGRKVGGSFLKIFEGESSEKTQ